MFIKTIGTQIVTYPIVITKGSGVLFNNLKFKTSNIKVNNSRSIHFVNMVFENQPIKIKGCYWLVSFNNCHFSGYATTILTARESSVDIENCKFYGNTTSKLIDLTALDSELGYPDLKFNNSLVVKNKNLEKIIYEDLKTEIFQNVIEY